MFPLSLCLSPLPLTKEEEALDKAVVGHGVDVAPFFKRERERHSLQAKSTDHPQYLKMLGASGRDEEKMERYVYDVTMLR